MRIERRLGIAALSLLVGVGCATGQGTRTPSEAGARREVVPSAARPLKVVVPTERADEIYAAMETSAGTFVVRLHHRRAPRTVQNFIDLAEGAVNWFDPRAGEVVAVRPYYDGLTIHRVVPGFVIQGGCPLGDGRGHPGWRVADEFHPALRHTGPGVVSMANSGPDSNGSQFFVTLRAAPELDQKHSVFGHVVAGMDVVEAISRSPAGLLDQPEPPITIRRIVIERH